MPKKPTKTPEQYLKQKAQTVRSGMRQRSGNPDNVPKAPAIYEWLKDQPLVCAYSNQPLNPIDFSVDHRVPLHRGGTNSFDNLCLCTKPMNNAKGTMTDSEFMALLQLMSSWDDGGKSVLTRLKIAGSMYG